MDEPYWDAVIGGLIVRKDGPWIVAVSPMLFNDRILLTHERDYPHFVTAGYCYDKGGAAPLAAMQWNPLEQERPVGYKKIAIEDLLRLEIVNEEWRSSPRCSTEGCFGDIRYIPPGRGHIFGCTYKGVPANAE